MDFLSVGSRRLPIRSATGSAIALIALAASCVALSACRRSNSPRTRSFELIARFPHDPTAYTQGLVWADSVLFESTGLNGHSELRRVDLRSGRVLARRALPADRFGEGLALLQGRLYQLTWKAASRTCTTHPRSRPSTPSATRGRGGGSPPMERR